MPLTFFASLLLAVILAGGLTVWLISLGGPTLMAFALPALLIAAVVLHRSSR
ncbi:hypothetical protein Z945_2197 [Sulfitobacter noctilucae]|uniref:hypothetical protein n=1 Tax=Sulfitobacter noctilucae TaxID=1342302 RepID=UPI000AAF4010|nr:hypothetical protein [Sulfitobacter noctilucae]KIN61209.1 hypothetical protein Z945_2197 [Sulfitobacter noctilucae]